MNRLFMLPFITLLMGFCYAEFDQGPAPIKKGVETAYPEHLTGAFTGGFGEETCRSCHFDYDLNPAEGSLEISGFPQKLSAGELLEIQIKVERKELEAAGFQLSARYEDGSQAGKFVIKNDDIVFTKSMADSIQYVQHSNEGTRPYQENSKSWIVKWKVPSSIKGSVVFNVAANAANGDQSEFGDFIYTKEMKARF